MEKIKLKDDTVLEIIPMGIETNNYNKIRKFSFKSELGYGEIERLFNIENISSVHYLSVADEVLKTYNDCIGLKSLSKVFNSEIEDGIVSDIYVVELEIQ